MDDSVVSFRNCWYQLHQQCEKLKQRDFYQLTLALCFLTIFWSRTLGWNAQKWVRWCKLMSSGFQGIKVVLIMITLHTNASTIPLPSTETLLIHSSMGSKTHWVNGIISYKRSRRDGCIMKCRFQQRKRFICQSFPPHPPRKYHKNVSPLDRSTYNRNYTLFTEAFHSFSKTVFYNPCWVYLHV